MPSDIFTAYTLGLLFTVILNFFNLLLARYLKSNTIFSFWNRAYRSWIVIIISVIIGFKYQLPSQIGIILGTTLYFYFHFHFLLEFNRQLKNINKIVISVLTIHLIYSIIVTFIFKSLFYRGVVNNLIYTAMNLFIATRFASLPNSKIKKILIYTFTLSAMVWFTRFILFFLQDPELLIVNNFVNTISIYALTPIVTLKNIAILLYLFDNYHKENLNLKKESIKFHNDAVFSSFLNSLFHEINTPLSVALTGITSIERYEKSKEKKEIEKLIEDNLNKIVDLLNDRKLVYGVDEEVNRTYRSKDLDTIIKRIVDKNFMTKNLAVVTSFHSGIVQLSLRKVFNILLPILELFQSEGVIKDILLNFIDDNTLEIVLTDHSLINLGNRETIKIEEDSTDFIPLGSEDSTIINRLSLLLNVEHKYIKISHKENMEIYTIVFK